MRGAIRNILFLSLGLMSGCGDGIASAIDQTCRQRLLEEVQKRGLSLGRHDNFHIVLPGNDGKDVLYAVNAVIKDGGRIVLLIKTVNGAKGNYHGYVFSNKPIPASEIGTDAYGRRDIRTEGIEANPPVVDSRIDAATYEVFFDLG